MPPWRLRKEAARLRPSSALAIFTTSSKSGTAGAWNSAWKWCSRASTFHPKHGSTRCPAEGDGACCWRGHWSALRSGRLSTGAIKAIGALALAAYVVSGLGLESFRYLADVALLILTTNLFNLVDLRPGRAEKLLVLLGVGLCLGAWTAQPIELLGVFFGPVLVGALFTLREKAMLGDTGSNLVGAIGGVWLLTTLGGTARLIALAIVAAVTVYGEFRSISALIERVPPLRLLDSLGRLR